MVVNKVISRFGRIWVVLLLGAILGGGLLQPAGAQDLEGRVLPQLQREAKAEPGRMFRVIVSRINKNTAADARVAGLRGKKLKNLPGDSFVAELPGRAIAALGRHHAVKYVSSDARMIHTGLVAGRPTPSGNVDRSKLGTLYPGAVDADVLWTANGQSPAVTGLGIGVAVLDTGLKADSPDWQDASGTHRIVAQVKFNSNTPGTNDPHGHGTHVASIIGGNSWFRSDSALKGKYIGIAPRAKLINVKVSDDAGMSYVSDVVNAIEWVIANRTTYNIRVMNLSMVSSVAESARTSVLAAAVERAWFKGILVVVAAGNGGPDTMHYPPANDPFVITVGAADMMGTDEPDDNTVAPWSSYGTTQDGHLKPELVAPGRYIVGLMSNRSSTLAQALPDRVVDGYYLRLSGTSMAAPIVSGIAALAFQRHPEWTNDQVKWLLMQTANKLGSYDSSILDPITGQATYVPEPGEGKGEADARKVVDYNGTPGFANQGLPVNDNLVGPDGAMIYDSANWSSANWSSANWSSANWSSANWSSANWSSANWSSANWATSAEIE